MRLAFFIAVLFALLAPELASAQGITNASRPVASRFTSTAPSGTIAYGVPFGSFVYWGTPGVNGHYLYQTGADAWNFGGPAQTYVMSAGYLSGVFGATLSGTAIGTCSVTIEGRIVRQTGTGGTNSGSQTRLCACVSDGAASPTYSWRNLVSGTAGNATTCNP